MPAPERALAAEITKLDEIASNVPTDGVLLLSDEGFGNVLRSPRLVQNFARLLRRYSEEVHIVMYARHPVGAYASGVQQRLKGGHPISPTGQSQPQNRRQAGFFATYLVRITSEYWNAIYCSAVTLT